jgi:hypothetical protein
MCWLKLLSSLNLTVSKYQDVWNCLNVGPSQCSRLSASSKDPPIMRGAPMKPLRPRKKAFMDANSSSKKASTENLVRNSAAEATYMLRVAT